MGLEDLLSKYVLGDGQITSLEVHMNYQEKGKSYATVKLVVRKPLKNNKLGKCRIKLQFEQVIEIGINEDYGSDYYSDITLVKQENGTYYLSLDSYGNTGEPHEDDILVIIANILNIEEE